MALETALPSLKELGGCIFGSSISQFGYSRKTKNGKTYQSHRLVWEELYGEIPKGMVIDHVCHNVAIANDMCLGEKFCIHRSCINPAHLRMITSQENQLEGLNGLRNRKYCKNGHELAVVGVSPRNRNTGRTNLCCNECTRINNRASQRRYREKIKVKRES